MSDGRELRSRVERLARGERWAADLAVAAGAALLGGKAAIARYGATDLGVDEKDRGPVTDADRDAHAAILGLLADERPGDSVVSEEGPGEEPESAAGRLWVVDPLDGTREFIDGIDEFSVMVGLAVAGEASLGAVYRPALDRLYLGAIGEGAWELEAAREDRRGELRPLRVPDRTEGPLRFVRSRSHPDEAIRRLEATLGEISVILSGSVGTKCAKVAAGEADLYVHPVPYLKEWDTCAPETVLRGAGGRVTDCLGEPLGYGKADPSQPRGIFAAPPRIWEEVASTVREVFEETRAT